MKKQIIVYFVMVNHPLKGWMRCGKAYATKADAKEWVPFVRASWSGFRTKAVSCVLTYKDGVMTQASVNKLSIKFNMDAPRPNCEPGNKEGKE